MSFTRRDFVISSAATLPPGSFAAIQPLSAWAGRGNALLAQSLITDGTDRYKGFERASTFADPATRWPDFHPDMPPRPSLLAITKIGGGKIA